MTTVAAVFLAMALQVEGGPVKVWIGADPTGSCTGDRVVFTPDGKRFACQTGAWADLLAQAPAVVTPAFSPVAGTYYTTQSVSISSSTSGASIYYTTNGSTPTTSSTHYSGPVSVTSSETIQAIATKAGMSNSAVGSASYTITIGSIYALPADRATLWQPGVTYNGGIPTGSWATASTVTCANTTGDLTTIQNAVNAAHSTYPAGVIVPVAAGTCNLNSGTVMLPSYTVLRGAGAGFNALGSSTCATGKTCFLATNAALPAQNTCQSNCTAAVIMGPQLYANDSNDSVAATTLLTADATKESYSVTVTSHAGFTVGQYVKLDENTSASWQTDASGVSNYVLASSDFRVAWQCHNTSNSAHTCTGLYIDDPIDTGGGGGAGVSAGTYSWSQCPANTCSSYSTNGGQAASWFTRQDRVFAEYHQIASCGTSTPGAACLSNTITFTTPIHYAYRTSNYAELSYYSLNFVEYAGVENIGFWGFGDGAIDFNWAAKSWIKNVEVTQWYGVGINIAHSFQCEVRDSYVHDADWPVPGSGGYAIGSSFGSSEYLIENNISLRANKVLEARASGAGAVVAYNYLDDGMIGSSSGEEPGNNGWIEIITNGSHLIGAHHTLFEGNWGADFDSDCTHGNSVWHTAFRNYFRGWRTPFTSVVDGQTYNDTTGSSGPYRAVGAVRYSYFFSWVGNILGTPSMTGVSGVSWTYDATSSHSSGAQAYPAIWMLGWNDLNPYTVVPGAKTSAIRDGNYDYLSNAQCWHGLGGTQSYCPTTPPGASTLPTSLYLSSAPAFFTTTYTGTGCNGSSCTWPWVNPVSGTTYTLPALARYLAGTPNLVH